MSVQGMREVHQLRQHGHGRAARCRTPGGFGKSSVLVARAIVLESVAALGELVMCYCAWSFVQLWLINLHEASQVCWFAFCVLRCIATIAAARSVHIRVRAV